MKGALYSNDLLLAAEVSGDLGFTKKQKTSAGKSDPEMSRNEKLPIH